VLVARIVKALRLRQASEDNAITHVLLSLRIRGA
jgi:hypothetical protein